MNNTALLKKFAKQPERRARAESANCVIYTRVSTKEQADNNMSLAKQMKACEAYAYKNELNVLASFGGTYESAKTDERKEFTRMLNYVKNSRHKVAYILVYSFDRFSRSGPNAIYISESLRKQGIQIRAVTQPVDAMTPTGALQQNILFIFSELKELLMEKMEQVAYQMNAESLERVKSLQMRLKEVQSKLERLDERYVEEDLNRDLYEKFQTKYKQELEEVQAELQKAGGKELSNLSSYMKMGLEIASNICKAWVSGSFALRRRLQYLVFPEGIYFDAKTEGYRTERVNFIFALIRSCSVALEVAKNKLSAFSGAQSHSVPGVGLEPT